MIIGVQRHMAFLLVLLEGEGDAQPLIAVQWRRDQGIRNEQNGRERE